MSSDEEENTVIRKIFQRKIHVKQSYNLSGAVKGRMIAAEKCCNVEGKLELLF